MADGDMVKMKLTFWRDGKKPGDLIDVPADEVHRWKGFAVEDTTSPSDTPNPDGAPADSAPVADWRTYAVKLGLDKVKADKATKTELQNYVAATTAGASA